MAALALYHFVFISTSMGPDMSIELLQFFIINFVLLSLSLLFMPAPDKFGVVFYFLSFAISADVVDWHVKAAFNPGTSQCTLAEKSQ